MFTLFFTFIINSQGICTLHKIMHTQSNTLNHTIYHRDMDKQLTPIQLKLSSSQGKDKRRLASTLTWAFSVSIHKIILIPRKEYVNDK